MFSLFADNSVAIEAENFLIKGDLGQVHSWPSIKGRVEVWNSSFENYTIGNCDERIFAISNYFNEMVYFLPVLNGKRTLKNRCI